jgi:hypothetical protein
MKSSLNNIILSALFVFTTTFLTSCSDEEVQINPTAGLTKISEGFALGAGARVEVWAKDNLFAGLNQVYFALYDSVSGAPITSSHIRLNPVMDMHTMTHSCPVLEPEEEAVNQLFPAEILFTMPSGDMGSWTLELKVHNHVNQRFGKAVFNLNVVSTDPSEVISFKASSGQRYYLSYIFPKGMKVGVNDFEVVAYTFVDNGFVPAENLSIIFTPEMPSMDHGSPNNVDPIYRDNGHYVGRANFTMTGDWRLNLQLSDGETNLGSKYFDIVVH